MSLCFRMGSSNTHIFSFVFFTLPSGPGLVIPVFSLLPRRQDGGLVIPIFFPWFFFFGGHLPQTSGFRSAKEILIVSFATQPRAFILSPRGGGEQRRGLMPLGLFLFSFFLVVTCPRPPVFARPNILVTSFATQARACILSNHNIFYTPRGGGNGRVMPLGFFLFFHGHLPQTPSF